MDEIDRAQEVNEMFQQEALRAYFAGRKDGHTAPAMTVLDCIDCGGEIETARLEAKPDAARCIDCQIKYERRARLGIV